MENFGRAREFEDAFIYSVFTTHPSLAMLLFITAASPSFTTGMVEIPDASIFTVAIERVESAFSISAGRLCAYVPELSAKDCQHPSSTRNLNGVFFYGCAKSFSPSTRSYGCVYKALCRGCCFILERMPPALFTSSMWYFLC